ncbi:peroxidase-like isoform X4 [Maniola jurtina]|uniref:peroxidase-like isoform X4 n=1 Tax=Maniola jurtina TaxID=191418 RepID=UPI001E688E33|nr:peroxidase-like isoform X4 [Maniola jurtina]
MTAAWGMLSRSVGSPCSTTSASRSASPRTTRSTGSTASGLNFVRSVTAPRDDCSLGHAEQVSWQSMLNDKCIPICVAEDDPFYRQHGVRCLNFVRSVTAPRDDCSLGHAEQVSWQSMLNDKCIPICVAEDDPFYRQHGVRCLNFVRSVTAPRDDCSLGHAEQVSWQSMLNDKCIPICVAEDDPFYRQHGVRCLNFVRSVTAPRDDCSLGHAEQVSWQSMLNDKCIPICVAEDDPFYRQHGVRCLNFVRSVTAPRDDCSLGHAEQMNTVSSFLDGSILYGSDPKLASKLRSKCGGRLKEETRRHCKGGFLPSVDDKLAVCDLRNLSEPCYLAGDTRINQTPTLAALHTLLLREHNRVADVLADLNPLWSDEKLFQEARRVVVAEIQHITYQEWLPLNFGESYLRYYRISPSSLYSRDYNDEVNPGVINSFGAAAFRFLHTVVPDTIMLCPASCQAAYLHKLSDHYFNPSLMEATPESFDDLIRGIITHRSAEVDPHCTAEITNLLFKSRNKWGLDLIAMDIQRGRDHGIASYNDYREICGLQRATTFQDLASEISQDRIAALGQLYESVDDIDLFVGGALERPVPGSILGHTFQCIVAEQFYRTRVGDRFFYDNSEMAHSFTPDQLKELKKASMARLICDNTGVKHVQRRAFEVESGHNPKYSCDDYHAIPCVDLTAWKRPKFELYD